MLDSLSLHSYIKETALMLINGTTELASVQLVLKFLGTFWWERNSCHSQHPAVCSLTFV